MRPHCEIVSPCGNGDYTVNNLFSSRKKESPSLHSDTSREAIHALRGYIYQIYHSALAWLELESEEFLFLEVAEDYAKVAQDALNTVQVKETAQKCNNQFS